MDQLRWSINKTPGVRPADSWRLAIALVVVCIVAALASACSEAARGSPDADGRIAVVTTSNIVADWVTQVGGRKVQVTSLLPVGVSPHAYSPGARDVARVSGADLVLTVGLGLEAGWLGDLVVEASGGVGIVELGPFVDPMIVGELAGREKEVAEYDRQVWDPHFWLDPLRVIPAVREIAALLAAADPAGSATYRDGAEAYAAELEALHEWIAERVATIDPDRRRLVTSHDTLAYFADRYGFAIIGSAIPGTSTNRETSPREMADLIEAVKTRDVAAVFMETVEGGRLIEQVARETGARVVTGLFTESLGGPGSGAETYVEMMRADVESIVGALREDAL